jgi:threonyl-tRNA synthetase
VPLAILKYIAIKIGIVLLMLMKILEFDVDSVRYELIKPEAKVYDNQTEKISLVKDCLLVLMSVESGDREVAAERVVSDISSRLKQLGRSKVVIYPFAHLSNDLAGQEEAREILNSVYEGCKKAGIDAVKAPFGWNKKLTIDIKGHPLAEQGRSYGGAPQTSHSKKRQNRVNLSIVKKSDWSGLPETDHRSIGEKLDLYSFQEVSPGMVYWHHNGHVVMMELLKYIREKIYDYGYMEVSTPAFANLALWHVSGHIDHYRDDMFTFESDSEEMGVKPMNCPSSILIFKSKRWSYRDMPVRFADFDKLYRNEISGALTGLFRVREFAQDDAHIFLREDQIGDELVSLLRLVKELYGRFNLKYEAKISTMPDEHLGEVALWDKAITLLKTALETNNMEYGIKDKDGAFYGPKIDFQIKDSMGREWQCATVQLDYQLPKRFGLSYTGEDGKEHEPVIIHRVVYGSLERFIGILVEHLQGKFPTWLAPEQVRVITISDQANSHANSVYERLKRMRIRASIDSSDRTLQYKIRDAQMQKVPYMLVIGKKEAESGNVTVRDRSGKQKLGISVSEFEDALAKEISERSADLTVC